MNDIDYKILSGKNSLDLERKVIDYIKKGYNLAGGHQVTVTSYDTRTNSTGQYYRNPDKWEITQTVYKNIGRNEEKVMI